MSKRMGMLMVLLLTMQGCENVSYVSRLVIVNPTAYDLQVEVRGENNSSSVELGIAKKMSDTVRVQVIDVGSRWRFRFEYLGQDAGEVSVTRSQLVRDSWRIVIPEDIGGRLEGAGVDPSVD